MTLIAVPLNPLRLNERTATTLLDGMVSMPNIFPLPGTLEERRVLIASILSDPHNRAWMVWQGSTFCGNLLLTHITPRIDALCHFCFFDKVLYGRKTLIWNMMGRVFHELDLQRLSVQVPEHLAPLVKFVRTKLHFRYEGEDAAGAHPLVVEKVSPYVTNAAAWAARLGSRTERAYWRADTNEWVDLLRLRLLREEWEKISNT